MRTSKVIVIGFNFLPDRISSSLKVGAVTLTESVIGFQIDRVRGGRVPPAFAEVVAATDATDFEAIKRSFPFVRHFLFLSSMLSAPCARIYASSHEGVSTIGVKRQVFPFLLMPCSFLFFRASFPASAIELPVPMKGVCSSGSFQM